MRRVFKFKKGEETEDLGDSALLDFLQNTLVDYENRVLGNVPTVKDNFKVTIIVEKLKNVRRKKRRAGTDTSSLT